MRSAVFLHVIVDFYPLVVFDIECLTVCIDLEVSRISARDDRDCLVFDEGASKAYPSFIHVVSLFHTPL